MPKVKSVFFDFVRHVVNGDIDEVSRRLAASPSFATALSDVGATRQDASSFCFTETAHYLYAGDTALHMAATAFRRPVAERDCFAVEPAPASREITNAFWNACRGGQASTAEDLLERGANLNWIGHDGKTPFDAAQSCGDENLVHWLRARGAKRAAELK